MEEKKLNFYDKCNTRVNKLRNNKKLFPLDGAEMHPII